MYSSNKTSNARKKFRISVMITLSCLLLSIGFGWATEYQILQLTDNDYDDYLSSYWATAGETLPCIHNGQVVWEGWDGNDSEICFYDGTNVTQLTHNVYDDWYPQIHNAQVVWQGYCYYVPGFDPFYGIFLYDGGTNVMQLSDMIFDPYEEWHPQIHDGQVVWQDHKYDEATGGNTYKIFLYDGVQVTKLAEYSFIEIGEDLDWYPQIHNGQVAWQGAWERYLGDDDWETFYGICLYDGADVIQLTGSWYEDELPRIHNGQVVWERYNHMTCRYTIFLYDGANIIQLADNVWDGYPQIHNGQVVWEAYDGNDYEIFLYDGANVIQLTANYYDDWGPQIHNGQVVWACWDGNDDEILLYDGADVIQLADNVYLAWYPQLHNGQVVWEDWDGNDYEIFLYDGAKVLQLTDNDYDDLYPQIHNGQVVWHGWDGNDYEIFLATPAPGVDILIDSDNDGAVEEDEDNAVEENDEGFVLWVNDDNDHWDAPARYRIEDKETAQGQEGEPDNANDTVNGIHDLEDFFSMRLQIPTNIVEGEKFYLEGAPVRIFKRYFKNPEDATNNVGPEQNAYLTDLETAKEQHQLDTLGQVEVDSPLEIEREHFTNGVLWLVFEGVSAGGPYDLQLYREIDGQTNGVDTAKITVKDVGDMYKFWNLRVDRLYNKFGFEIYNPDAVIEPEGDYYPANPDKMFVFLHGYNVDIDGARQWCDTMYKRLFRAGYRGGFSGITWEGDIGTALNFRNNWTDAFRAAELTERTIVRIKNEWGQGPITVGAHSLGNAVVLAAVRKLAHEGESGIVNKVVHLQAAVPADVYHEVTDAPLDYFDGSFRPNFDVVPAVVNSWSPQDEVLETWFNLAAGYWFIFGLPTPNYKDDPVIAPPIVNIKTEQEALGQRDAVTDFPSGLPTGKTLDGWNVYMSQKEHPYGIRDHSSMANEYYLDVTEFFNDLTKQIIAE